ncbi:perivitellin-2 67 kDa subunit-like [Convolutriloba macropyga]|uniref:perivitellin-2 67 kDa subunit-like n=1 Tax=Convolutriloba macropyga TaxID=536237 RepID=UPI003F523A0A
MTLGVDLTSVDFEPFDMSEPDGFRTPVIEFTCDKGKTWRNPFNNITYQMPDQVWSIVNKPGSFKEVETKVYENIIDIKTERTIKAKVKKYWGLFSASASYKKLFNLMMKNQKVITETEIFASTVDAYMAPPEILGLSEDMKTMIELLPKNIEDHPEKYFDFILQFGTHFISVAEFGGYIKQTFATSESFYRTKGEATLSVEAKLSFQRFFGSYLSGSYDSRISATSQNFLDETSISTRYHGGDVTQVDKSNFGAWQKSIPYNPWLYSGNLIPISELISDEDRKYSMEKAFEAHGLKNYLQELKDQILSINEKYQMVDTTLINSLLDSTEELMSKMLPNETEVEQLSSLINYHLVPPDWWKGTHLCMKARRTAFSYPSYTCGTGKDSYCGSGFDYSPFYKDRSYYSEPYCQLSWGIVTPVDAHDWFKQIQLCFRVQPESDSYTCGNAIQRNGTCAPVNNFTQEYLDATTGHNYCKIYWKLKAPESIPYWFQNTQLCLNLDKQSWYCKGQDYRQTLCASHNEWTPYVADRSRYHYHSDCGYQWGFIEKLI